MVARRRMVASYEEKRENGNGKTAEWKEFLRLKNEIRRDERRGGSLGKLWVLPSSYFRKTHPHGVH